MSSSIVVSDNYVIQQAINLCGHRTIDKLNEFHQRQNLLENDYKKYALIFIEQTLKINHSGDTKKRLTTFLIDVGFGKSNVSKMIGAQEHINCLEARNSKATDWAKSLPVSTTYVLGTLDDNTFARAWEASEFGEKKVSKHDLEKLKQKHMPEKFPRGNNCPVIGEVVTEVKLVHLQKAKTLLTQFPDIIALIDLEIDKRK